MQPSSLNTAINSKTHTSRPGMRQTAHKTYAYHPSSSNKIQPSMNLGSSSHMRSNVKLSASASGFSAGINNAKVNPQRASHVQMSAVPNDKYYEIGMSSNGAAISINGPQNSQMPRIADALSGSN